MTIETTADRTHMYLGYLDPDRYERHISLVPHVPGLEAICGQPVKTTRPGPWRAVITTATCPTCRTRGLEAAHPVLSDGPPRQPARTPATTTFVGSAHRQHVSLRRGCDGR